jgi:site-specific DNA-methyltransferase (adenine-specific)
MIFSEGTSDDRKRGPVELDEDEIAHCSSPLWTMSPAGSGREHPYQSPKILVRRMIALFTDPGDLVVDPFAGAGTTLAVAVEMGRRAVGYEIEERYAKVADESIGRTVRRNRND